MEKDYKGSGLLDEHSVTRYPSPRVFWNLLFSPCFDAKIFRAKDLYGKYSGIRT
jgi:hypothetical protein